MTARLIWQKGWRDQIWSILDGPWDIIVIGGGITGAGILREAARSGLRVLLVEGQDFASGTSSRSSKLVHGGFRYLKNGEIRLTLKSVRERERLLQEGRGLINSLGFLLANYAGDRPPRWVFGAGLILYDLLALKWSHRFYDAFDIKELCPPLNESGLRGGYRYFDAQTDDARLVLRVIQEAVRDGGVALNYARATGLLRNNFGQICGIVLRDGAPGAEGRTIEISAPVVINATGAWADHLRAQVGGQNRIRQLRGSHLIFPRKKLPLTRAISFQHPEDRRFVYALPWEGVTIFGTTDVDHSAGLQNDPAISASETEYLLTAVQRTFPGQALSIQDVQATFSGVRPVIGTGLLDPSKESREHVLWRENGLLTVTGGKLTTFRLMAHDALQAVRTHLPGRPKFDAHMPVLDGPFADLIHPDLSPANQLRLLGRYAADALSVVRAAQPGELKPIADTPNLWAELRWAARAEGVVHLDDLLLRRVRLGLLLPEGGLPWINQIRKVAQTELGWNDIRWESEVTDYTALWKKSYHCVW